MIGDCFMGPAIAREPLQKRLITGGGCAPCVIHTLDLMYATGELQEPEPPSPNRLIERELNQPRAFLVPNSTVASNIIEAFKRAGWRIVRE